MSDKRSVNTDALQTLGTIITDGGRDAIHLAVEPVIAGEILKPGQDIGLVNGLAYKGLKSKKFLGIVDPFLEESVKKGEMFWLIVYPRQITSLRHVWSHPDFPEDIPNIIKNDNFSVAWIKNFAETIGTTYKRLMEGAEDYVDSGDYMHMGDNEEYSEHYDKMEEFWHHYSLITGKEPKNNGSFFSCSC